MDDKIQLDKEYIKTLVQVILNKNHPDNQKRYIVEHRDRLNFACPICGDSEKHNQKKRGNLYFKNMYYVCYNEESCSRTFTNLLKTFGVDMDLDKKLELYEYIENNINYYNPDDVQFDNLNKLFDLDDILKFFGGNNKTVKLTNLRPLSKGSVVERHVTQERKIPKTFDIYEGIFHITEKWQQPVMVYMNKFKNKVISFQVRNLLEGEKRMFKIYDFSMIFDIMYPDGELDDQERISYDKLSHFFNIFNIDFSKPVHMFEGYTDSLFLSNSIGQIGVNTDLSFLLKEEGIEFRFIYDNDEAGFKKSRKMLEEGRQVFLWNKFFIDMMKDYKGDKPKSEMIKMLKNIKDFNSLGKRFKQPIEKIFNFDNYFTKDELDIYYFMDLEQIYKTEA
jgi:hypothetical protein